MALSKKPSLKQNSVDKLNRQIVIIIGVAVFAAVFTLVASKTLLGQYEYQKRVIDAKHIADLQLKANAATVDQLVVSYKNFINTSKNVLGGNTSGNGQNDGNNAEIVLDALPSQYDFPGFISSLENLLSNPAYTINNISGTDNALTQQASPPGTSTTAVQIPFQINATGSYASIQQMIQTLQASIRPIVIQTLDLSGNDTSLTAAISAYTYYQPGVVYSIQSEVVK
jgi:hypothetical protein